MDLMNGFICPENFLMCIHGCRDRYMTGTSFKFKCIHLTLSAVHE